jgi:hypothetical protein
VDGGHEADATADPEDADALGPVELVWREGEEVEGKRHGHSLLPHPLRPITHKRDTPRAAGLVDGRDGLDDAGLVVGPLEDGQTGAVQESGQGLEADDAAGVNGGPADGRMAAPLEVLEEVAHRGVLDA